MGKGSNNMAAIASTELLDALRPKSTGEPVNAHVICSVEEPQPDFAAIQRLLVKPCKCPMSWMAWAGADLLKQSVSGELEP